MQWCRRWTATNADEELARRQSRTQMLGPCRGGQREIMHSIASTLIKLHRLPAHDRIFPKLLSATYRSVHENPPLCVPGLISAYISPRSLRRASESFLDVPGDKVCGIKRYGLRAFKYMAHSQWNTLPGSIRDTDSLHSFRSALNTHFFLCSSYAP